MAERKPKASRYAPGLENLDQIVRAAEKVLVEQGHAALTLRRIADECGLKVGNLSYYFPTKQLLVKALLDRLMVSHQGDLGLITMRDEADAEAMLTSVMFYWMRENQLRHTSRLYVELWSMANNDPYIRQEVDKGYERGMQRNKRIFAAINSKLTEEELDALALLAISIREGLMVFANEDRPGVELMPLMASYTVQAVLQLARNPDRAALRALEARWRSEDLINQAGRRTSRP